MKTVDLTANRVTLDQLLKLAAAGSVRILTADGRAFVLEAADDFDKEVEFLGKKQEVQAFSKPALERGRDNVLRGL